VQLVSGRQAARRLVQRKPGPTVLQARAVALLSGRPAPELLARRALRREARLQARRRLERLQRALEESPERQAAGERLVRRLP
jgi:hypothetical protein